MAVHLEIIVPGPPISNQQRTSRGKTVLANWRAAVSTAVRASWSGPKLTTNLRATIINFHVGPEPPVDLDNMSKPIFDEMQADVYGDDRQIRQARLVHLEIGAPVAIANASKLLVTAIRTGGPFVYVRVEDPESPYPLPG
ncbi:RusA family crossover junction endodeoxyribonuclease [Paludisphaera sp.]|uniref:RusA family crossover junction endodeoxyribonuclease n=1 Tax=Paludisphaera sp. TaxID=2017432 RepID=UPI00301CE4B6